MVGSAQTTAQLALSHSHFPPPRQPTQKELMLQGQFFRPIDKELLLERERCNAACWRFNNSTNPNNGVSATERSRLFREILVPTEPVNLSPTSPVSRVGRVGEEVIVEAPFTCDYGYNITIAPNVFIGRNCTFLDCASIKIGKNTYIGPNVSIFTAELDQNPSGRMGGKSLQKATPVIIEEDVWIDGNVTILPGVRVGKGSTVSAGTVVHRVMPTRHPPCAVLYLADVPFTGCTQLHRLGSPQRNLWRYPRRSAECVAELLRGDGPLMASPVFLGYFLLILSASHLDLL